MSRNIKVNNSLVTSEEGTYAIGDVAIPLFPEEL